MSRSLRLEFAGALYHICLIKVIHILNIKNGSSMNPLTINAIRDLALTFEKRNLQVAYELMAIAFKERPNGPFIKSKFYEYKKKLENPVISVDNKKVLNLLESGKIAIVPIGFRCHTKMKIKEVLGFSQASLPFDSGFFSPYSVASIFAEPKVELSYSDDATHTVCVKNENFHQKERGKGVKFELSSYQEIDALVSSKNIPDINKYLDSTFGYYTLDKKHKFVLADYNWHYFSNEINSKGITNPKDNIPLINKMLNERIDRMLELCKKAEYVFFVYLNQNGDYLNIGDEFYDLTDYSPLEECLVSKYKFNFSILNGENISANNLLNIFENKENKRVRS